jgi:hypothetical protein
VAVLTTARKPGYRTRAVSLRYDAADPLAVRADFGCNDDEDERIEWTFARDLLIDALDAGSAGPSDVVVTVLGDAVELRLWNGREPAETTYLPTKVVRGFVDATLVLVPRGREVGDFDQELAEWLDGAR